MLYCSVICLLTIQLCSKCINQQIQSQDLEHELPHWISILRYKTRSCIALQLFGSPPIKNTQLWNVRSRCTFVIGSSNFLCRFQYVMALSSNFFGPVHYVLPGKKTQNTTFAAPVKLRLVSKNHKKLIHFLS